ncbi:MAG: bifunctional alpha,alpha-trehalose-phosphate synthase (UDP-forming)/trehalose-phosphatase [Candidatus Latescibacteria bacterium]|nr:bifunctional alpha,alpha-trehalose-phosphate synthase (UDP-forming)/trehalose-phosphatase [Candidatus Latescibacterota bacterium]
MERLIIISNRLPVSVTKKDGKLRFHPSAGGLATGVQPLLENTYKGLWVGWPGIPKEKISVIEKNEIISELKEKSYCPVFLSQSAVDNYYSGFSNRTIWPLFHYFTQYAVFEKSAWSAYRRVNKQFFNVVSEIVESGDTVWIHDYHLMLLPRMLREKFPDLTIGFFLHIPFPSFEVFRLLPWRSEILEGLLGADLIGFHIYDYARHFLSSLRNRLGYEHSFGQVLVGNRYVKVDAFPMGIDYERYAGARGNSLVQKEIRKTRKKIIHKKIILSVDRLDYTKGILHRLRSFDLFLEKHTEYKEKVTLILVAVPSRTRVEHYKQLKKDVDESVGRLNGKHGTLGWMPVVYLYGSLPFHALTALYILSDVALVTPVRDGMNLIAKEYIAAKTDGKGVLILSEMAGAAAELSESIIVNPNNIESVSESIYKALKMPEFEQKKRNKTMQDRLRRYNVEKWADDFIKNLAQIKEDEQILLSRKITPKIRKSIISDYIKSKKRLILLDYDGTLRDFEKNPQDAIPDRKILRLLIKLSDDPKNDVLIISGRDKYILETWFKSFNLGLIAEHGVWVKEKGGAWELIGPLVNYWKDEIRPILEKYMDRTPGSFIEEKDYSLVWHFRKSNPELASNRARELKEAILHFTSNLGISVLEGNKVIEIKNAEVNKGNAALKWISRGHYDFILAAGDDRTDEDIFTVLPGKACSFKVGMPPSKARYIVESVMEFRTFMNQLLEK